MYQPVLSDPAEPPLLTLAASALDPGSMCSHDTQSPLRVPFSTG
eukprot:CAMPEP_0173451186 /NCGR_PEP_ID=MMETSP1357-20121228/46290_1 /TAXON_ID=77926 /ORGANISM="Hemiselmis rufescens, Strain PCC563" /LENGTH=43 /DNA_ID= /DNA_START= /DNA_END= /DNA_ORIENTATION=